MQNHTELANTLNHNLSLLTIIGSVAIIVLILHVGYRIYIGKPCGLMKFISATIWWISFGVALAGSFLTLFYSQYLGYAPCDLCWYQRVFLYPQVLIFIYAGLRKDRSVLPYTLLLSVAGFCIALYHHFLQIGYDLMKPCSTAPFAVDCAKPSFVEFGFVTFPFMAVVLFAFLGTLSVIAIKTNHK